MKEGLIQARVNRFANLSEKIQQFVHQKSSVAYTPFYPQEEQSFHSSIQHRTKRSLTDWRQLYKKNPHKIQPRNSLYPSSAEGFRTRCSNTGQCQRSRKAYTAAKFSNEVENPAFLTRQSKRTKIFESKRQCLVEFAHAQNCYEKEVLKDEKNLTFKAKRFYQRKGTNPGQKDIVKMGIYLSNISEFRADVLKQLNTTQKYIREMREFQFIKMAPYNHAKIKEKYKIDNNQYIEATSNRGQSYEYGLRYYQRA